MWEKTQVLMCDNQLVTNTVSIVERIEKKERSSNIELYRIIVMLLIVSHHYVVNSGLIQVIHEDSFNVNSVFFLLFGAWGKTGINCFVLITGYYMCTSRISLRKFLKLFLWVETYVIITLVFIMFDYCPFGIKRMLWSTIPLKSITNGFTSCFFVFYLTIPFLNILIKGMTKKLHQLLILLLLFIYTFHGFAPFLSVSMNYVSWFCVLYIISSYLRLYPIKESDSVFWGWMTFASWSLSVISILTMAYIGKTQLSYFFVSDSNVFLALTNGITSFMWFKSLKIKNNKLINTIAASAFGVLIIHANSDTMRQWLWKDVVDCVGHYNVIGSWLYAICSVVAIYTFCTIIDYIRIHTIETSLLNFVEKMCLWVKAQYYNIIKS